MDLHVFEPTNLNKPDTCFTGQPPLDELECDFFALPAWHGGLGYQFPPRMLIESFSLPKNHLIPQGSHSWPGKGVWLWRHRWLVTEQSQCQQGQQEEEPGEVNKSTNNFHQDLKRPSIWRRWKEHLLDLLFCPSQNAASHYTGLLFTML